MGVLVAVAVLVGIGGTGVLVGVEVLVGVLVTVGVGVNVAIVKSCITFAQLLIETDTCEGVKAAYPPAP